MTKYLLLFCFIRLPFLSFYITPYRRNSSKLLKIYFCGLSLKYPLYEEKHPLTKDGSLSHPHAMAVHIVRA